MDRRHRFHVGWRELERHACARHGRHTATFNADSLTVNNNTTIDLGGGVTLGALVFDTSSAAAYTIGSGAVAARR